ncbi:MAG: DUF4174 domain-containing protein [Bacteroidota bacterium]
MKHAKQVFRIVFLLIIFIASTHMNAQDLDTHKWKNRILIIKTNNATSETFQAQLKELRNAPKDMMERKFVLYQIIGSEYTLMDYKSTTLANVGKVHGKLEKVLKDTYDFEVILIGLDGGVKLRQTKLLTKKELFDKVDSMPMRRSELRRKN